MFTPLPALCMIVLPAPEASPPTKLFDDVTRMPLPEFPAYPKLLPVFASGSAPMKLPQTKLPCEFAPEIEMPACVKPLMIMPSIGVGGTRVGRGGVGVVTAAR